DQNRLPLEMTSFTNDDYKQARVTDIDRDGNADLLMPVDGTWVALRYDKVNESWSSYNTGIEVENPYHFNVIDVDGNGVQDLFYKDGNWKYRKGAGEAPGLLTKAVNGLKQVQSVRYWNLSRRAGSNSIYSHTASAPPSVLTPPSMANGPSLPGEAGKLDDSTRQLFADGNARFAGGSLVVVSSIEVDNGYNENGYQGRISTGYRYAGAVLDLQGRGFLGFREVRALNRN